MSMTRDNKDLPVIDAQDTSKLKALLRRWRGALARIGGLHDSAGDYVLQALDAISEPAPISLELPTPSGLEPPTGDGNALDRQLVPLPNERSQALAVLCDRLLQELDGEEVRAAEIRFVVHRHEHPGSPRLDPDSAHDPAVGELVWELRRLIAWSGGAIADVARALETRGADLDQSARALLSDELAALDVDLATLNVHLADPVDWDTEFGCLLAGEVAPFDDLSVDDDDNNED